MKPDKSGYNEWAQGIEDDPRFVAEMLKLEFAEELVKMLEARGLKRTELAEKLGTHRGYVTRVLNTDYNLTIETMARIALALDARIALHIHARDEMTQWMDLQLAGSGSARVEACWPKECGVLFPPTEAPGGDNEHSKASVAA